MEIPPDVTEEKRKLSRVARLIIQAVMKNGFPGDIVLYAEEHGLPVGEADTCRAFLSDEWGLRIIPNDGSEEASQHFAEVA